MIASLLLIVVAVVNAEQPGEELSCTYWCRDPVKGGDYVCCDDGNPWYTGGNAGPPPQDDYVILDSVSVEADDAGSSGCRYFCHYNDQVYCCDNGEGPLPIDHENNAGRCPTEEEQSCKVSSDDKKPEVKISSVFVDKHDKMCASDGYCAEEEKCCPNKCRKKHTCMPAF